MRISDWSSDVCSSDLQRQVAAIRAVRDGQVAMDALAVSGRESEGLGGCHCILVQPLPPLHQETCLARVAVVQVQLAGIGVAVDRNDDELSVIGMAGEVDHQAGKRSEEHTSELQSQMRIS